MEGMFQFPTVDRLNFEVRARIMNTPRGGADIPLAERIGGENLKVELSVFEHGELIHHDPEFGSVPPLGSLELSPSTCPHVRGGSAAERVVAAKCIIQPEKAGYFAQEHELTYRHKSNGNVTCLLYDQLPIGPPDKPSSPIVLLAHKIWVSEKVNTFVSFVNRKDRKGLQDAPLSISILAQDGTILYREDRPSPYNEAFLFDVRASLRGRVELSHERPTFFNICARGGSSSFAISTFIINETRGTLALEHSLAPSYYTDAKLDTVRREAAVFPA